MPRSRCLTPALVLLIAACQDVTQPERQNPTQDRTMPVGNLADDVAITPDAPCASCPLPPTTFIKEQWRQNPYVREFAANPLGQYVLIVADDGHEWTGAVIKLNGTTMVDEGALRAPGVDQLSIPVALLDVNRLKVLPLGERGAIVTVTIKPGATPAPALVTFTFSGDVGLTCQICGAGSGSFGSGITPGTALFGTYTFDPATPPTPVPSNPNRVRYYGVSVDVSVGSETVTGNDAAQAYIEIHNGPPGGDSYSLIVDGGFPTGTLAGRSINRFFWVVSAAQSLFPDTSLPLNPGFFGPLQNSWVCIGDCSLGVILEGRIAALTMGP